MRARAIGGSLRPRSPGRCRWSLSHGPRSRGRRHRSARNCTRLRIVWGVRLRRLRARSARFVGARPLHSLRSRALARRLQPNPPAAWTWTRHLAPEREGSPGASVHATSRAARRAINEARRSPGSRIGSTRRSAPPSRSSAPARETRPSTSPGSAHRRAGAPLSSPRGATGRGRFGRREGVSRVDRRSSSLRARPTASRPARQSGRGYARVSRGSLDVDVDARRAVEIDAIDVGPADGGWIRSGIALQHPYRAARRGILTEASTRES